MTYPVRVRAKEALFYICTHTYWTAMYLQILYHSRHYTERSESYFSSDPSGLHLMAIKGAKGGGKYISSSRKLGGGGSQEETFLEST
jgi:hypothetical protein